MKKPYLACIDVTYRCTLRCKHCYNYSGNNGIVDRIEMREDQLLSLSEKLFPIHITSSAYSVIKTQRKLKCVGSKSGTAKKRAPN